MNQGWSFVPKCRQWVICQIIFLYKNAYAYARIYTRTWRYMKSGVGSNNADNTGSTKMTKSFVIPPQSQVRERCSINATNGTSMDSAGPVFTRCGSGGRAVSPRHLMADTWYRYGVRQLLLGAHGRCAVRRLDIGRQAVRWHGDADRPPPPHSVNVRQALHSYITRPQL